MKFPSRAATSTLFAILLLAANARAADEAVSCLGAAGENAPVAQSLTLKQIDVLVHTEAQYWGPRAAEGPLMTALCFQKPAKHHRMSAVDLDNGQSIAIEKVFDADRNIVGYIFVRLIDDVFYYYRTDLDFKLLAAVTQAYWENPDNPEPKPAVMTPDRLANFPNEVAAWGKLADLAIAHQAGN